MKISKISFLFLISLSILGLFSSFYLFYVSNFKKGICEINGCNVVLSSKYSKFLGIENSLLGIFYFSLVLFLLFILNKYTKKEFFLFSVFLSFIAFIFALRLIYLQFFIIKELCFYCLLADASSILIFMVLLYNLIKGRNL